MISVVIPTYNRAQTIRMAVDSVLNQTYRDIELIIVDDASTDGTQDVVTQIADDRIRYLRLEQRSGACNARNIGALSARGEFISFQDSDDKWHLDKLEKQYRFMIDRNLDFSFCGMTRIMLEDPNRKYYYPNVDMDDNKDYFDQLLYLNRVGTQTIICKRECFEKIRFDVTLKRFQDWDFALQAARIYSIGYLRESLVDSFVQKDSISKSSLANKNAWESLYNKYKKDIQKNPTTYAKYLFRLGNEVVLFNQKVAMEYYRNSFYTKKSKEALVFFVLSSLRMKSTISKLLDYGRLMWRDLEKLDNVDFINKPLFVNNVLIDLLFRVHFSFKLNMKIELPLKRFWEKYYSLDHYDFDQSNEYVILFTDPSLCNYRNNFLEKLKRKSNVTMVLVLINSFYRMRRIIEPMLKNFDLIYTYDEKEAKLFGFSYYPTVYSMVDVGDVEMIKRKCFFVGVAKDRLEKLIRIYDKLELCGCNPIFYISGVPKKKQKRRKGIVYNTWLPYKSVLKEILSSEFIVEIMDKNNAGITLRTLEAICYNRKLVTDNEKILCSPFYREQNIYLLSCGSVLLSDFLKCVDKVDYGYDGRYSPVLFVDKLDRYLNKI